MLLILSKSMTKDDLEQLLCAFLHSVLDHTQLWLNVYPYCLQKEMQPGDWHIRLNGYWLDSMESGWQVSLEYSKTAIFVAIISSELSERSQFIILLSPSFIFSLTPNKIILNDLIYIYLYFSKLAAIKHTHIIHWQTEKYNKKAAIKNKKIKIKCRVIKQIQ